MSAARQSNAGNKKGGITFPTSLNTDWFIKNLKGKAITMTPRNSVSEKKKTHWEDAYEHKETDQLSWFQSAPAQSLQMIANAQLDPHDKIVDAGGGASTLVDHLLDLGYDNITVVDIASQAISTSQKRLGNKSDKVTWVVNDLLSWSPANPINLWHDRAVFHFLVKPDERRAYLEMLSKSMPCDSQVIIATFALDGPQKCSGLPVCRYDAASLSRELGQAFELLETAREEHITPAKREQRFTYCRFRRK
jgi:hypothetical protein